MHVGIVSNSELFAPLAMTLAAQGLQVSLFYAPSPDPSVDRNVMALVSQMRLACTVEHHPSTDLYAWSKKNKPEVCFVVGYRHRIDLGRWSGDPLWFFNVHFGPLPQFRGPNPVFWQLKRGLPELGLSIHRLSARYDEGPLVWNKWLENQPHYTYRSVNLLFSQQCVEGCFWVLQHYINRLVLPAIPQEEQYSCYWKAPVLKDVLIDWSCMGAEEICHLIRACNPWNKGAITTVDGVELKVMDGRVAENASSETTPGAVVSDEDTLSVCCCDGKLLRINTVCINDCYVPAYHCGRWGLVSGKRLG
jgi:methionyl-tRNA formyltransferase